MTARIICVGNRYVPGDDTGPRVYDRLAAMELPDGIELIDGGLGGIRLLGLIEGIDKVVFVDSIEGFDTGAYVAVLDAAEMVKDIEGGCDHSDGLASLLKIIPSTVDGPIPDIKIIGMEGEVDDESVEKIAYRCIELLGAIKVS